MTVVRLPRTSAGSPAEVQPTALDARIAAPATILRRLAEADPSIADGGRWLVDISAGNVTNWQGGLERGVNPAARQIALGWLAPLARAVVGRKHESRFAFWTISVALQSAENAASATLGSTVELTGLAPALAHLAEAQYDVGGGAAQARTWLRLSWHPGTRLGEIDLVRYADPDGEAASLHNSPVIRAWLAKTRPAFKGLQFFAVAWRCARLASAHEAAEAARAGAGESRALTRRVALDVRLS